MAKIWKYMSADDGLSGTLFLVDGIGPRAIVELKAAPGGHCVDTGRTIAALLTVWEKAGRPYPQGEDSGKTKASD